MKEEGVTDLDQYAHCPGTPLSPDFFIGDSYPVPDPETVSNYSVSLTLEYFI